MHRPAPLKDPSDGEGLDPAATLPLKPQLWDTAKPRRCNSLRAQFFPGVQLLEIVAESAGRDLRRLINISLPAEPEYGHLHPKTL